MTRRIVWLGGSTLTALALVAALRLQSPAGGSPLAYPVVRIGKVYTVAQFVQTGSGPLWTTKRRTLFLIHGVLRRVPMQPVADYLLADDGSGSGGNEGLALSSTTHDALLASLLRVPLLSSLLPRSTDNPLLGKPAVYRVLWIGCLPAGCARSPWQLESGGD